jgi:hypothetical protein
MNDPPLEDNTTCDLRVVGADCIRKNEGKRACGRDLHGAYEELVCIASKANWPVGTIVFTNLPIFVMRSMYLND